MGRFIYTKIMGKSIMINFTREELRADIAAAIKDNNHQLIKMINEDLGAVSGRIDNLSRRVNKLAKTMDEKFEQVDARFEQIDLRFEQIDRRFEQVDERFDQLEDKIDFTHKLLHVHIANPSAHARRSGA